MPTMVATMSSARTSSRSVPAVTPGLIAERDQQVDLDDQLAELCALALAWLLAHYDRTLLIPGTADPGHLAENIAAGSLRLSAASVAALDQLATPA